MDVHFQFHPWRFIIHPPKTEVKTPGMNKSMIIAFIPFPLKYVPIDAGWRFWNWSRRFSGLIGEDQAGKFGY